MLFSISTGTFTKSNTDWTTDISDILPTQQVAAEYIGRQGLEIELGNVNFMRIDLHFGNQGYSFRSLMQIGEKIEALSKDSGFAKDIQKLLD